MEKPVRPTKPKFKKPIKPIQYTTEIKLIAKNGDEYKFVTTEDGEAGNYWGELIDAIDISVLQHLPFSALSKIELFIYCMYSYDSSGYFAIRYPEILTDEEFAQAMDEYNKILYQQENEMLQYKIDLAEYGNKRALYDFETARIAYDNITKE